ncbi:hypothetical protein [Clostridium formicaceticum]|nr:hypothetical protein [Clostridium formicaceticum]
MAMVDNKIKVISAVLFQFAIVGILTYCLVAGVGDTQTIIGALIGLAVGVGVNSITDI